MNTDKKASFSKSLKFQIGLIYTFLAITNIIFFSVMIFENQSDLLTQNFKYQSENMATKLVVDFQNTTLSPNNEKDIETTKTLLKSNAINKFFIFDINGQIWYAEPESANNKIEDSILSTVKEKFGVSAGFFAPKYYLDLDEKSLMIRYFMPISTKNPNIKVYLYTHIDMEIIRQRQQRVYIYIGIAVGWGIIFHILFGIYVYRAIFVRVGSLKAASDKMAEGDLKTRVDWKFKSADELDELGLAFNQMAKNIDESVAIISRLNNEIGNELKIGKEVQEMFLPTMGKFKNYKISVIYRPMREVSGDIYHFYKFTAKRGKRTYTGLFFADASGHGVSAALVTVVLILSLESVLTKTIMPGKVISMLGDIVGNRLQASFFATSVFFLINDKGYIYGANAGHNPPIYYTPSTGEMTFLKSSGPPLGMVDEFNYKTVRIKAKPGDKLFIYSDGLVESPGKHDENEQFGEERVIEIIKDNLNTPSKELLEKLANALEEFKLEYRDDVSLIQLEMP